MLCLYWHLNGVYLVCYLYVCDGENDRVQVFNKSFEFLFLFIDKMDIPVRICVGYKHVYVTQFRSHILSVYSTYGKYLQSVGGNVDSGGSRGGDRGDISPPPD